MGRALKPLLSALVLASAVAAPVFAEELSTFKGHLLYCEEVVEHDDDFTRVPSVLRGLHNCLVLMRDGYGAHSED